MVPLRSATTGLGTPALISDCAPMIERVRPAQLTTTRVSGSGARVADPVDQLRPGRVDAAGDAHRPVFREGPAVEDHEVRAGVQPGLQVLGADAGRAVALLDHLAEGLGGHIDAREELEARRAPGRDAALQDPDLAVAGRGQHPRRPRGQALAPALFAPALFASVAEDHRRRPARHQVAQPQLQVAERQVGRQQDMAPAEDALLPDVRAGPARRSRGAPRAGPPA